MNYIVVHFSGEIGSKGANRRFFEKKLRDNIRSFLPREAFETIFPSNSRLIIKARPGKEEAALSTLKYVTGISFFAQAQACENRIEDIRDAVQGFSKEKKKHNIRIFISNKTAGIAFEELKKALSEYYDAASQNELYIEVLDRGCYVCPARVPGLGGLPVGASGKLISLLSGGIDSPVAAFRMYRRGCSISFVHFFNPTQQKESVITKIYDLVSSLSKYQFKSKLYVVRFDSVQREIIKSVPSKYRMILYRRFMLRIGESILQKEGAKGFVTGDSLGQVASQTLDNIGIIYNTVPYPVFHPLIGEDKDTIIRQAKEIGTYDISIRPYNDCCSFFVAEHPETRAVLADILNIEKSLDIRSIVAEALKNIDEKTYMRG